MTNRPTAVINTFIHIIHSTITKNYVEKCQIIVDLLLIIYAQMRIIMIALQT